MINKRASINLGPLHVDLIETLYGHELDPGDILLTVGTSAHARRRHPLDFDRCLPFVGHVVANPTYIGDDLHNSGKIELVGRMPTGEGLLVAVIIEKDVDGFYRVASFYPVTQAKIDHRRRVGILRNVIRI